MVGIRFPNTDMIRDPRTKHFCENGDTFNGWIGPDVHFLFSTIKNGQDCCWVLTHKVCGLCFPYLPQGLIRVSKR
jgi:hypothetical protein